MNFNPEAAGGVLTGGSSCFMALHPYKLRPRKTLRQIEIEEIAQVFAKKKLFFIYTDICVCLNKCVWEIEWEEAQKVRKKYMVAKFRT